MSDRPAGKDLGSPTFPPSSNTSRPAHRPRRLSHQVGNFLSKLNYLLLTLAVYFILALFTYAILLCTLWPAWRKAGFIAYEIATGGDPYNFFNEVANYPVLWEWLLILHLIAWLMVPILVGTAADAAFRQYEERRSETEKRLRQLIKNHARERLHLSEEDLDELVESTIEGFRRSSLGREKLRE